MENKRLKKGISLIVLVITIIVIIILAAAVILTLTDNNPIENAKQATFINDLSAFQDELDMYKTNEYAKSQGDFIQTDLNADSSINPVLLYEILPSLEGKTKYENDISVVAGVLTYKGKDSKKKSWAESINIATPKIIPTVTFGTNGGSNATEVSTTVTVADTSGSGLNLSSFQYVWDTQNVTEPVIGWDTFTNEATLTKSGTGIYYLWIKASDNNLNNIVTKSNAFVVGDFDIPDVVVSTIQTEHKTFAGATTGFAHNNPVIPVGFVAVNTTRANWNNLNQDYNNGLVIQDLNGNQFVWVPVDGNDVKYEKNFSYTSTYGATSSNTTDDTLPSGVALENTQINTYKGFYIARFEAGNVSSILVSKKASNVWNNISYINSKNTAEGMYIGDKVKSGLVTGTQWDTTLKWIQNSGKSVTNSIDWGNHSNSIAPANITGLGSLQVTGYSNYWQSKNIYDFAGNESEWVNEKFSTEAVARGGCYLLDGTNYPVSYRDHGGTTVFYSNLGFRLVLYII